MINSFTGNKGRKEMNHMYMIYANKAQSSQKHTPYTFSANKPEKTISVNYLITEMGKLGINHPAHNSRINNWQNYLYRGNDSERMLERLYESFQAITKCILSEEFDRAFVERTTPVKIKNHKISYLEGRTRDKDKPYYEMTLGHGVRLIVDYDGESGEPRVFIYSNKKRDRKNSAIYSSELQIESDMVINKGHKSFISKRTQEHANELATRIADLHKKLNPQELQRPTEKPIDDLNHSTYIKAWEKFKHPSSENSGWNWKQTIAKKRVKEDSDLFGKIVKFIQTEDAQSIIEKTDILKNNVRYGHSDSRDKNNPVYKIFVRPNFFMILDHGPLTGEVGNHPRVFIYRTGIERLKDKAMYSTDLQIQGDKAVNGDVISFGPIAKNHARQMYQFISNEYVNRQD